MLKRIIRFPPTPSLPPPHHPLHDLRFLIQNGLSIPLPAVVTVRLYNIFSVHQRYSQGRKKRKGSKEPLEKFTVHVC